MLIQLDPSVVPCQSQIVRPLQSQAVVNPELNQFQKVKCFSFEDLLFNPYEGGRVE